MKCFWLILIVLPSFGTTQNVLSQAWLKGIDEERKTSGEVADFYDIQNAFNSYWSDRPIEKGKGWKQFKRWENFMEARIYPEGSLMLPDLWLPWEQNLNAPQSNSSSWTMSGPVMIPEKPSGKGKAGMGRINCIAFHPTNQDIFYAGSPSGGLWKTSNGGLSWTTSTDKLLSIGVSDIAVNPSEPDIIYIATGDGDAGDTYSVGILKSIDGGETWNSTKVTLDQSAMVYNRRIIINPNNPDILLATSNIGIYRTADGFASFSLVKTGNFKDIEFKPGDPSIVYATSYSANGNAKIYRSTDGGLTFNETNNGLSTSGKVNRIELAVSPANPNYIYALCSDSDNDGFFGLYKSVDAGAKWTNVYAGSKKNLLGYSPSGKDVGGQGWYDLAMAVLPTSISQLYVGGINIYKSINGGSEFTLNTHWIGSGDADYVHADQHMIAVNPLNNYVYSCNDGGVYVSKDNGDTWTDISNGLSILQIYKLSASSTTADFFVTGNQDNGSYRSIDGIWEEINKADGMECWIDPSNDSIVYTSYYYGSFYKSTDKGVTSDYITPPNSGRGAWITPFLISEVNPAHIFAAYGDVFKSYDRGEKWHKISNGLAGGDQFQSLAVSAIDENFIYAATFNKLWITKNGGVNWNDITSGLSSKAITSVTVSPNDPLKVWVTFSGYNDNEKVFFSDNGGQTWNNYSDGLPNVPVNTMVYQKNSNQLLYAGTDLGVYFRNIRMSSWEPYNNGLPNVIVNDFDIQYKQKRLIAGSYGRGLWTSPLADTAFSPLFAEILLPSRYICIGDNYVIQAKTSPQFDSLVWSFSDNLPSQTILQNEPVSVIFSNPGPKSIRLSIYSKGEVYTTIINGYAEAITTPEIQIVSYDTLEYFRGSTATFMTLGASDYIWDESPFLSNLTGNIVSVNAATTTVFYVTGSAGSCAARKSFQLNVIPGPINDDVCSALHLETGRNGPFTNNYASVEKSEPLPDTTDCNTQLSWCNQEGGLQATVWFKYLAGSNIVSFLSEGFDTQIALYEASSCEDIISGNYTILAANDDFYGEADYYAAAIEKVNIMAGNTYYLQVDGSAGGEIGEFYITVLDNTVQVHEKSGTDKNIKIYPNPSGGDLKIQITNVPSEIILQISDYLGKVIQTHVFNNHSSGTFERNINLPYKGIFLFRISGEGINYVQKVLYE